MGSGTSIISKYRPDEDTGFALNACNDIASNFITNPELFWVLDDPAKNIKLYNCYLVHRKSSGVYSICRTLHKNDFEVLLCEYGTIIRKQIILHEQKAYIHYNYLEEPSQMAFEQKYELIDIYDSDINYQKIYVVNLKYDPENHRNACSICCNSYKSNDTVSLTRCNHVFHVKCMEKWFEYHSICPSCSKPCMA